MNELSDRHHGDLIAVDPSVNSPGVALFRHGVLEACERIKIPKDVSKLGYGARCLRVAQEIAAWWQEQGEREVVRVVVFEWPQTYRETKSKGDHNQLLGLVGVGQSLAALVTGHNVLTGQRPPEIVTPTPAEWTGQLPKTVDGSLPSDPWTSPRGIRIGDRLEIGERRVVPPQHDAIDALGLGLWALGRYRPRRAFSGVT